MKIIFVLFFVCYGFVNAQESEPSLVCGGGEEVPKSQVCDGVKNCADGFDEDEFLCQMGVDAIFGDAEPSLPSGEGEPTAAPGPTPTEAPSETTEAAPQPQPPSGGGDLQAQYKALLDSHNARRSKLALGKECGAPKAKFMRKLVWDDSIAAGVQAYTDKCIGKHDPNLPNGLGENLAQGQSTVDGAVEAWFREVDDMKPHPQLFGKYDYPPGGQEVGHFAHVAWSTMVKIGCGVKDCQSEAVETTCDENGCVDKKVPTTSKLVICRYSGENALLGNTPIYEEGEPCSDCAGTCTDGLCEGPSKSGGCFDGMDSCGASKSQCNDDDIKKLCSLTCTGCTPSNDGSTITKC